jgi:hypothetical protein
MSDHDDAADYAGLAARANSPKTVSQDAGSGRPPPVVRRRACRRADGDA